MRKLLVFTAALLCAASTWAYDPEKMITPPTEGPWTFDAVSNAYEFNGKSMIIRFYDLDHSTWGRTYQWQDTTGTGFTMACRSREGTKYGVFSTYYHTENVEPFTRLCLTWTYRLCGKSDQFTQCTAMYADEYLEDVKGTEVDFSDIYVNPEGYASDHLLDTLIIRNYNHQDIERSTGDLTATFNFDNHNNEEAKTKWWSIMLVHVAQDNDQGTDSCNQWGSFKHINSSWTAYYYKEFIFYANGGEGSMGRQEIETSGTLTPNAFTRHGYTFTGWATHPNYPVKYTDQQEITATADDKGSVVLYAKWNIVTYTIDYTLNGGSADNPANYNVETETFTLANPTRDGYTFLGWTGSNGDTPELEVTIPKGSMGNKTYTANWSNTQVFNTIGLINALPDTIVYTEECHNAILAARAAYDALTEDLQPLVTNYATLTAAESVYSIMDAKAKIAAIGVVTIESKEAVEAARDAYNHLTPEDKAQLTAFELETLQDAEVSYAMKSGTLIHKISFRDKDVTTVIKNQFITLIAPAAPTITGFIFQYWQVIEENISDGTIRLQAFYEVDPSTAIDEVDAKAKAAKLIRNGNVYILTDEFIYTINGQRVK